MESCLVTPIPHSHYYWWLWWRSFLPPLVAVLVLYLPLLIAFDWLRSAHMLENPLGETNGPHHLQFRFRREIPCDLLVLILLFLPWVQRRVLRLGSWLIGAILLYFVPIWGMHLGGWVGGWKTFFGTYPFEKTGLAWSDIGLYGTHAQFHPAVTILYFLVAAAWSAAIGVSIGLRRWLTREKAFLMILFLGPFAEWLAYFSVFFTEALEWSLVKEWMFLWMMLSFYLSPTAILWMGMKWNLLFYLSRRPLQLE